MNVKPNTYLIQGDPTKVYETTDGRHSRLLGIPKDQEHNGIKVVDREAYEQLKKLLLEAKEIIEWVESEGTDLTLDILISSKAFLERLEEQAL